MSGGVYARPILTHSLVQVHLFYFHTPQQFYLIFLPKIDSWELKHVLRCWLETLGKKNIKWNCMPLKMEQNIFFANSKNNKSRLINMLSYKFSDNNIFYWQRKAVTLNVQTAINVEYIMFAASEDIDVLVRLSARTSDHREFYLTSKGKSFAKKFGKNVAFV